MLTNKYTLLDDQRKDNPDQKRPRKRPPRNIESDKVSSYNITDGRCRQSGKVSRDKNLRAEWPAKLDVILK